jgi:hypothetical protein
MTNGNEPINPNAAGLIGDTFCEGLTKREYFAAQALSGLLSKEGTASADRINNFARYAVEYADALINRLNAEAK